MKLSIIIPVYNQEELVIKCLDSIPLRDDIEILLIDDGSTDNTYKNILNYKNNSTKNIRLFKNNKNMSVGYSRNRGIENSTGEYIMFVDSDDYLYPVLNEFILELTGEDIVYYGLIENDNTHLIPTPSNIENLCGTVKAIKNTLINNTRYPHINFAEDWYFNKELLNKNPTKKFTNIYLLHYNHPRKNSLFDLGANRKENNND